MHGECEVTRSDGRVTVTLRAVRMGDDLLVALDGGDGPHIGAVAVSQPRPSLRDAQRTSASTSVITLLGHKEDEVARWVAQSLAIKVKATVCVACGIHLDDITEDEIVTVQRLVGEAVQELVKLSDLSPGKPGESS